MDRRKTTLLICTDLDGTLLDAQTYSYAAAWPAIELVRRSRAFLVPCTSKTRAEVLPLIEELGFQHPFIVENGGAIYLPRHLFEPILPPDGHQSSWIQIPLGIPYHRLVEFLDQARQNMNLPLTGFHDLSAAQIATICGLSPEKAALAKEREFDEPFLAPAVPAKAMQALTAAARTRRMSVTSGGRFYHLAGGCDKGTAVKILTRLCRRRFGATLSIGLGDSPNDLPMLLEVDRPVLVRKPDGHYHPELTGRLPAARQADGIGPHGWNAAIQDLFAELGAAGDLTPRHRQQRRQTSASKGNFHD